MMWIRFEILGADAHSVIRRDRDIQIIVDLRAATLFTVLLSLQAVPPFDTAQA